MDCCDCFVDHRTLLVSPKREEWIRVAYESINQVTDQFCVESPMMNSYASAKSRSAPYSTR